MWVGLSGMTMLAAIISAPQPGTRGLQVAGAMDLARLVDLTASQLKVSIEYDAGQVKGSTTLRMEGTLTERELWELTNRQLVARGLTTIVMPGANAYTVVQLQNAAGLAQIEPGVFPAARRRAADANEAPVASEPAAPGPAEPPKQSSGLRPDLPAGFRSIVYKPEHAQAKVLQDAVRQLLSKPGGAAQPFGDAGMFLLSDLSPRLEQILDALALLDVPAEDVQVTPVTLKFVQATQAVALATQLELKRQGAGSNKLLGEVIPAPDGRSVLIIAPASAQERWQRLIEAVDQLEPVATRSYAVVSHPLRDVAGLIESTIKQPSEAPPDPRFRLVSDELTQTLIITANAAQHEAIEVLLHRLEAIPGGERRQMRSIPVQHRPADQVIAIVASLLSSGAAEAIASEPTPLDPHSRADERSGINRYPGGVEPPSRQPSSATSPRAVSLPESEVTLTLDSGTSTIIAIGPTRLLDQVEALVRDLDVRQRQVELQVLLIGLTESQTRDLGAEIRGRIGIDDVEIKLSSLFGLSGAAGDAIPGLGSGSGASGLILNPTDFSVLIRALETINDGRTLSMPRVIASNSQQATVDSVLQQPYSSVNASNTVSTTSFGGTQDAGTQVTLRPQVSSADHIILEYSISLSAFVGEGTAEGLPPPRQQNRLSSIVTIPDGHTIAIGGIELNTDSEGQDRVPFLGELPLVGELLKTRSKSKSRQRFYAFIRPTILQSRDFADLKYLSDRAVKEAGIDDGWPDLEPRMIR